MAHTVCHLLGGVWACILALGTAPAGGDERPGARLDLLAEHGGQSLLDRVARS